MYCVYRILGLWMVVSVYCSVVSAQTIPIMQVFEITNDSGNPDAIEPLGGARPIWRDDRLIVNNIGSSGDDGVSIGLVPDTDFASLGTRVVTPWWDEGDRLPVGAMMSTSIYGIVDSGQEQLVGNCSLLKTGPSTYDYSLDFSPLGASTNTFNVGQPGGTNSWIIAVVNLSQSASRSAS